MLSGRRKQFLQKLLDLYSKTKVPVHYETLAQALGVSKWTSYDMLKELEKLGYLIRDYIVHPGEAGRSQIVFRPTDKTSSLFGPALSEIVPPDEWNSIKSKALEFLHRFKNLSLGDAVRKMLKEVLPQQIEGQLYAAQHIERQQYKAQQIEAKQNEAPRMQAQALQMQVQKMQAQEKQPQQMQPQQMPVQQAPVQQTQAQQTQLPVAKARLAREREQTLEQTQLMPVQQAPVSFCAQTIGLFLACLNRMGDKTESWIRNLVQSAPSAEMRTTLFVGAVLGAIMQKMGQDIGNEAATLAGRYMQTIHGLSEQEKGMLSDFLMEALVPEALA